MTPKKTPTLAALRRLAKRKGMGDVLVRNFGADWVAEIDNTEPRGVGAYSPVKADAIRMLFAALSALPDKPDK